MSPDTFNFNNQDYEFVVRIYNGVNDIKLNNVIWEDLFLEEDIFDWKIKGSITIKSPKESFEKESAESLMSTGLPKEKLIYKFRNDGRDTIFISIKPIFPKNALTFENPSVDFYDKIWRIEIEAVIYDVEDISTGSVADKCKKLYFWEKTYQLMIEKDSEFSTATTGENANKSNVGQLSNRERSLKTGESVAELLKYDDDFKKHSRLTDTEEWDKGNDKNKIFYTSPIGSKFIDDLNYLMNYTVSSETDNFQPCILKFERSEKTMTPKQFSLKSIKTYFSKAGNDPKLPKEYQNEHFFLYDNSESNNSLTIQKAPLNVSSMKTEIKSDEQNQIRDYQLVDLSGLDYSKNLANYRVVSFNSTNGQFIEEGTMHSANEYKKFYTESIQPSILTHASSKEDRLVLTPFIEKGLNTKTIFSMRSDCISASAATSL